MCKVLPNIALLLTIQVVVLGLFSSAYAQSDTPASTCAELTFTDPDLQVLMPLSARSDLTIVSPNNDNLEVGRILGNSCYLVKVLGTDRAVFCDRTEGIQLRITIGGKRFKLEGGRKGHTSIIVGPSFGVARDYRDGEIFYLRGKVIRKVGFRKVGTRYQLQLSRAGSYTGQCN
jgi:hypothetical protein